MATDDADTLERPPLQGGDSALPVPMIDPMHGNLTGGPIPVGGARLPQAAPPPGPALPDYAPYDYVSSRLAGEAAAKGEAQTYVDRRAEDQMAQDRQKMAQSYDLEAADARDPALRPWNAEQEKAKYIRGPMENFGSVGMIFAMAASAFTRTPMISALNAGAAAMQATAQSDEKAYKQAFDAWKSNSDLALKRFDMERNLYEDANKLLTTDMGLWKQKSLMLAAQFDNQKMRIMLENGMDKEVLDAQAAQFKAAEEMRKSKFEFDKQDFFRQQYADSIKQYQDAHPGVNDKNKTPEYVAFKAKAWSDALRASQGEMTPEQLAQLRATATGSAATKPGTPSSDNAKRDADIRAAHPGISDTDVIKERNRQIKEEKETKPTMNAAGIDLAANMLIKGNPAATTNVGRGVQGAANLNAIRNRAAELLQERGLNPEESATLINENTAAFQGDKRGAAALALRSSQIIGASTVALNTMDRVLETSRKVSRTEFSDINKILLAGEQRTGDTAVINYGIALNTLINNYARAIGAGSNALTDTARREAHELLEKKWSQGQIESAIGQLKKELHDELRGAQEARKIWAEGGSAVPELGSGAVTGTPKVPPVNLLKEGTITTFSDGSKWKLQGGKAVQVNP